MKTNNIALIFFLLFLLGNLQLFGQKKNLVGKTRKSKNTKEMTDQEKFKDSNEVALVDNGYDSHFKLGKANLDKNNSYGAIDELSAAITFKKTDEAYYYRGIAKFILYDYQGAIDDFDYAIYLNPKHIKSLFYRGISHLKFTNIDDKKAGCLDLKTASGLGDALSKKRFDIMCQESVPVDDSANTSK